MDDETLTQRAELWMMVATMASDGNVVELGYDHDEAVAYCRVTDDQYEARSLAAAVRLAFEAREVQLRLLDAVASGP